jgi:hypothetical protein
MGHLADRRLGYCEHMAGAFTYASSALLAAVIFVIHGIIPDIFTDTGSNIIECLNGKIKKSQLESKEE